MAKRGSVVRVFAALAVLSLSALALRLRSAPRVFPVRLEAGKAGYLHYELVNVKLSAQDPALRRRLCRAASPSSPWRRSSRWRR